MSIDLLILIYLYVCCSMLLFDGFYLLHIRYERWNTPCLVRRIRYMILSIAMIRKKDSSNHTVVEGLIRKLRRPDNLQAFLKVMREISAENPEYIERLCVVMPQVMLRLAPIYRRKRREYRAYFSYQLAELRLGSNYADRSRKYQEACNRLAGELLPMLEGKTVFERGNACKAIVSLGCIKAVREMLRRIDKDENSISGKLLVEYLLDSVLDAEQMVVMMTNSMDCFKPWVQVVIVDYMRMLPRNDELQAGFCPMLFDRMCRGGTNKEVRLAIIRYFRRYPYPLAYKELIELAEGGNDRNWEYSAVAALSLASYPGEQTVETLKLVLGSRNWYVRFNAAESLIALGVDETELGSNSDSFAQGMLTYRNAITKLKEGRDESR